MKPVAHTTVPLIRSSLYDSILACMEARGVANANGNNGKALVRPPDLNMSRAWHSLVAYLYPRFHTGSHWNIQCVWTTGTRVDCTANSNKYGPTLFGSDGMHTIKGTLGCHSSDEVFTGVKCDPYAYACLFGTQLGIFYRLIRQSERSLCVSMHLHASSCSMMDIGLSHPA